MDNEQMKHQSVDADKILNHIKYTRHWLDKADEDYRERRFGPGGMILGLARAELTAAWEEAVQLKTQVIRKAPRKARAMTNWKNASVVGLMASGFLIAFMVIKFTGNPEILGQRTAPVVQPQAVVVTEQVEPEAAKPAAVPQPARVDEKSPAQPAETQATAKPGIQPAVRNAEAPRARRTRTAPVSRTSAPAPAVVKPVPAPERVIIIREPAPAQAPARDRLDDIDLYQTANDAIMN